MLIKCTHAYDLWFKYLDSKFPPITRPDGSSMAYSDVICQINNKEGGEFLVTKFFNDWCKEYNLQIEEDYL